MLHVTLYFVIRVENLDKTSKMNQLNYWSGLIKSVYLSVYQYIRILKDDRNSVFVVDLHRNVSLAAAPQTRVALLYFWVNPLRPALPRWRELSVLGGRIQWKLRKIIRMSINYRHKSIYLLC